MEVVGEQGDRGIRLETGDTPSLLTMLHTPVQYPPLYCPCTSPGGSCVQVYATYTAGTWTFLSPRHRGLTLPTHAEAASSVRYPLLLVLTLE